jgi:hypothetical protein
MSFNPLMVRLQPWALVEERMGYLQDALGKEMCDQIAHCIVHKDAARLQIILHCKDVSNPEREGNMRACLAMLCATCKENWWMPHANGICVAVAQRDPVSLSMYQKGHRNDWRIKQALINTRQASLMDAVRVKVLYGHTRFGGKLRSSL